MNNDFYMGGPMLYRGGNVYTPTTSYAPSFLSTQMAPMQQNNTNIVWTMGLESAKAYPLMPGRTLMLMDSESPRFFIKSVDTNGYATLKAYSFQEDQPIPTNTSSPATEAKWVTQEQLDAALAAVLEEVRQKAPVQAMEKEKVEVEVEKTKPTNQNLL